MTASRNSIAMTQKIYPNTARSSPSKMLSKRQGGYDRDSSNGFGPPSFGFDNDNDNDNYSYNDNDSENTNNASGNNNMFGDDDDSDTTNNLVNMYFLILAAFVILLLFGLWYWRRGKKLKRIASLGRRRNALQQDLEMGRRRERSGWLMGMRGGARREEGVDERGEAPPPYTATTTTEGTSGGDLAVPPAAHVRDGGPELPKYEELTREEQLARTPEGELVGTRVEERELSRESSNSSARTEEGMGQELVREPNVISNPRSEENGGGGATDAGIPNSATVNARDVAPGGTDRA